MLNNMKPQTTNPSSDKSIQLNAEMMDHIYELENEASEALETLLALYIHSDAFAVVKRFQRALSDEYALGEFIGMRDAFDDLGDPSGKGLDVLQRTLTAIKNERKAA